MTALSGEFEQVLVAIEERLLENRQTLGVAESCTGGLISALIAQRPGVSRYFQGSVVAYAGTVKHRLLRVPEALMGKEGQVSEPVALSMAQGACESLGCDWAVSVTGVAGPGGGSADKPVGLVCLAVVGPGVERVLTKRFESQHRTQIQRDSAQAALEFLWAGIKS